jgi:hypothetical protein
MRMRAMNEQPKSDRGLPREAAEIARLIWDAAQPLTPSVLDDSRAEELGSALKKAADWYHIAAQPRPPRERERLERIHRTAKKLSELLTEDAETLLRIEREILDSFGRATVRGELRRSLDGDIIESPHPLDGDIVKAVDIIRDAAERALFAREEAGEVVRRRRGSAILEERFGSPARLFVRRLAAAYEEATGAKAGMTFNAYTETIEGPFVRLTSKAAARLGVPVPDEETIKRSLDDRKMLKPPR